MRSVSQAALDAIQGRDDSLWIACKDILHQTGVRDKRVLTDEQAFEDAIRTMLPDERALYDIAEEIP